MKRFLATFLFAATAFAAENPLYAPDRKPGEGDGPFQRLIIRGATLIDGTGAPGGVRWTIHDGIIYDAKALLADVRKMVSDAKVKEATQ